MSHKEQIKDDIQHIEKEELYSAPPILYQLNTDLIRYKLYVTNDMCKETQMIYSKIIFSNLWINEPFHSTFFKILLILNQDGYFIRDPFSKIITSNLRNDANQMVRTESYLVLSVLQIIGYCIGKCIGSIKQFRKNDAQNITFSLMLLILQKSENILATDLFKIKKHIFKDYPDADSIEYILSLLEQHDERLEFLLAVYELAIKNVSRHPYVVGTSQPKLSIDTLFFPKKTFQTLPMNVF